MKCLQPTGGPRGCHGRTSDCWSPGEWQSRGWLRLLRLLRGCDCCACCTDLLAPAELMSATDLRSQASASPSVYTKENTSGHRTASKAQLQDRLRYDSCAQRGARAAASKLQAAGQRTLLPPHVGVSAAPLLHAPACSD